MIKLAIAIAMTCAISCNSTQESPPAVTYSPPPQRPALNFSMAGVQLKDRPAVQLAMRVLQKTCRVLAQYYWPQLLRAGVEYETSGMPRLRLTIEFGETKNTVTSEQSFHFVLQNGRISTEEQFAGTMCAMDATLTRSVPELVLK